MSNVFLIDSMLCGWSIFLFFMLSPHNNFLMDYLRVRVWFPFLQKKKKKLTK